MNGLQAMRGQISGRLGRSDRSAFGLWFWEIDRVLLTLGLALVFIGLIAVAAASPSAAARYSGGNVSFAPLHYFWRQLAWVVMGLPIMLAVSMMKVRTARRFALIGAGTFLLLLAATPFVGVEVNGARRWIGYGFAQLQPSEFLKPFFAVGIAWLLSLKAHDPKLPMFKLTAAATGLIAILLMKQPDMGQTVVFCAIWMALVMIAGVSPKVIGALVGGGVALIVGAYFFYSVARTRIDNFLFATGDTYQVDSAHATLTAGGLFGMGPGGGEAKFRLPEAHTDYIYSVIGEEFGLIACIAIAVLFFGMIARVFVRLLDETDQFKLLATAGLTTQLGVQATINMMVNAGLAPSKGMTLPFVSYGGSSFIALCVGFGLLLAFTRRNPYLTHSPYLRRSGTV